MGRKVFYIAKLRSEIETNKYKHVKVAIFFLRVKIGSVRRKIQKERSSFQHRGTEAIFLREPKTGTKVSSKIFSIIFVFSIYLFYNTVRCVFVCLLVRLFVCLLNARTRARKRVQYLHLQELACLLTAQKDTRREKTDKKHVQYLHLQELATLLTARKGTRKDKNNQKHVQVLHFQELASLQKARKGTRKEKNNKKHVQVLHLQELAALPTARKGTKREKNHKKHMQVLHLQELATLLTARKGTRKEKNNKKHVQVLHLQDIPHVLEAHFHCF